ncbi:glycosyltransferase family 1 protein [Ramlibacter sp. G-1-2-2]|uniref:Glycosyltransferase family 1 protein n=1 Tax=Ramlibacter agri TaxID=2728837 RepID=A0A848H7T0_9BURK|nr:glycosyltransferase [Ramlibacter agri]NML45531.1 glycosyltransferase family 1 protein [Ramlibacter agri]
MSALARVCLVGFGSAGDIHPLLALGQALRERGRAVTFVSNPAFATEAAQAGLGFLPAGEAQHLQDTIRHPKLWHPVDGFGVMWRYLLRPALQPTYERLEQLAGQGPLVVVASPVAMGARVAQERLGIPLVTAYTAATMLRTVQDPMTLAHWRVPRWWPDAARRAAWALLDRYKLEPLVRPALDALRGRLGLEPLQGPVFGEWMHSPQAGLALFPQWFAPGAEDWPRQVVQAGFPLYDEGGGGLPEGLQEWLEEGTAPVVFMPGTARLGAEEFFAAALKACGEAGVRGLLLGDGAPRCAAELRTLQGDVRAERYAPFGALLARTRALVHHGGIGSCAQALRAGIPQLVVPQAYDQFDNAMRLEGLGVGVQVRDVQEMPAQLRRLLASPSVTAACQRWSVRAEPQAARDAAVRVVEQLA